MKSSVYLLTGTTYGWGDSVHRVFTNKDEAYELVGVINNYEHHIGELVLDGGEYDDVAIKAIDDKIREITKSRHVDDEHKIIVREIE